MNDHKDLKSRARVYRQLRCSSDQVRGRLIPDALSNKTPAGQIYFDMVTSYFKENVGAGQRLSAHNLNDEIEHHQPTMDALARPRTHRCMVSGFEQLHPRYIQGVCDALFSTIDYDRARRLRGDFDPSFLLIVNFLLQLIHVAEDGTGRTNEDMLVLLAAETGRTLSNSQTGYRGVLEGAGYPIYYKEVAQRILFFEVVGNFYKSLGLTAPEPVSYDLVKILTELNRVGSARNNDAQKWPDGLGPTIADTLKEITADPGSDSELFQATSAYRFYAEFLAGELIYFTLCLQDPGRYMPALKSRYPASVSCCSRSLEDSLDRTYHPVADDVGAPCDKAVALIEAVKLGWVARDQSILEKAVNNIEAKDAAIAQLFRKELSVFLTESEKTAIAFGNPLTMTGIDLQNKIQAGVMKIRG
jgi:hypothetical protein